MVNQLIIRNVYWSARLFSGYCGRSGQATFAVVTSYVLSMSFEDSFLLVFCTNYASVNPQAILLFLKEYYCLLH